MSDTKEIILKSSITELPKSLLPASSAVSNGHYPFICSSPALKLTDTFLQDEPAVVMGTGGVASVHLGVGKFAYSTDTWAFRSCSPELDTDYLYHSIKFLLPRINYAGFEGSGLKHLRKDFVRELSIKVPRRTVAKKITRILQTIDRAIEQTEALIDKYQQIKAGLMHDLFTRGIGPDGQLRPPREQVPHLYQQTPIGWIPKEWEVANLEDLLAPVANNLRSGPFGSALLKSELVENGIPFLGIDNIHVELFVDNFRRFVSESKFIELSKYSVRQRDVIITIMGTVGRAAVVPEHLERALSSKHLWTMTFDQDRVVPELISWQLNHAPWVKSWFRRETQGGIMDAIQSRTLRTLTLPVPPFAEQLDIAAKYKSLSGRIKSEEKKLDKLGKQKSGLMHDLLTGTISVIADPKLAHD